MDDVIVSERPVENVAFFQQVWAQATAYRLSFARSEANNHQALERELPNLWEAARQCYEGQAWDLVAAFRDALQPFLDLRGYWAQSLALNEWAREAAQALGDAVNAARWTHDRADILQQRGEYREAEKLYQASEEAYCALGEGAKALRSRHMQSLVVRAQGRLAEAEHLCETTIAEARNLKLDRWLAHPLYVRGLLARDLGDFPGARQWVEESLSLLADTDELAMIGQCHHFLGEVPLLEGDLADARSQLEKSLGLSQQAGILRRIPASQRLLGDLARMGGRYEEAEKLYREALETVTRIGDQPQLARLLVSQAHLMTSRGRVQEAADLLRGAISTYEEIGDARGAAGVSLLLARLHLRQQKWEQALRMTLAALKTARSADLLRPRHLISGLRRWSRL